MARVIYLLYVSFYSFVSATLRGEIKLCVCEIFSVKEWCDLVNKVRVRSRSLEMAPFD